MVDTSGTGDVVSRAARVLDLLGDQSAPVALSNIARWAGIPKTTVWRLLRLLSANGLVERQDVGYVVGPRLVHIAALPEDQELLRASAVPFLVDLHVRTGGMVSLGVQAGAEVRYLERIYGHMTARTPSYGRSFAPAHCTAIGKVLLAYAPDSPFEATRRGALAAATSRSITDLEVLNEQLVAVRDDGIAVSDGEFARGVRCVASPVLDGQRRRPIAAVAIGDTTSGLDVGRASALIRRTAFAVSVAMRAAAYARRGPARQDDVRRTC
ncbi:IclR family transcriptional regulator [Nocardia tenerifensis]|uniref:IclR family transcriptional regulator n=1 Tax=Nocardia tenerifensis TaxID=228006 RepID=A0A318KZ74_9NOCA|nr:IclR family transcriptional regulator [Nocardia tenerifensis]PXX71154.1 IclR family transcriptional regulator [Nocardia tenerifensis]